MIFKVHWIVDGLAEIEAKNKEEAEKILQEDLEDYVKNSCLLYTSPSPRDRSISRMPSSA